MDWKTATDIMTRNVVTVTADTPLLNVIDLLLRHSISATPVVDEEKQVIGIISEHDVINFAFSGDAANTLASEAMTTDVVTFPPDAACPAIVNCFAQKRMRHVPIVADGTLVGIVSRRDVLRQMLLLYSQ